jgi:hypothetical protein
MDVATALEAANFAQICNFHATWWMQWQIAAYGFETLRLASDILHAKRSL